MRTLIAILFSVSLTAQTQFSPTLTGFSTNPTTECGVYVNDTTIADLVINMNTNAAFDARTDADNTTNYNSDKVHLTAAGESLAASIMLTRFRQILN